MDAGIDRKTAFLLLREVATTLEATGRPAVGAILKPELWRRSFGKFNQQALGFLKFGDFLREAANLGYIRLDRSGLDLRVLPPDGGHSPAETGVATSNITFPARAVPFGAMSHRFIRPDFWQCFVDYSPGLVRVYDPKADQAYKISQQPQPLEPEVHKHIRTRMDMPSSGLLRIEPILPEELKQWMRDFTDQEPELGPALREVLGAENAISRFTAAVRSAPILYGRWHRFRVERITRRIHEWLDKNRLSVEVFAQAAPAAAYRPAAHAPEGAPAAAQPCQSPTDQAALQDKMLSTIDELMDGLFRLRGIAAYLKK